MSEKITLDWNEYTRVARQAVSEGCVLLENKNGALPLKENSVVSVFGRIQDYYYKSGTGSGGMVNVASVVNIVDGLKNSGRVTVNEELRSVYAEWEEKNPCDEGIGWGSEPWSQKEMPLTEEIVSKAASVSETAVAIIGRTAGEDRDASDSEGSYRLTELEEAMLSALRKAFRKVVVLLNVGSVIDMSFVKKYSPDAVMYVWQGGMIGGDGIADVLTGKVSPSGKLTDTIAENINDYPSTEFFGDPERNFYKEDIFVGYRYFETFAKEKVLYPFGFGLSYSTFALENTTAQADTASRNITASVEVKNTGKVSGKEVVQLYVEAPQGKLGKASRVLCGYAKTSEISSGGKEKLDFVIPFQSFASYDDSGATGSAYSYVLEEGKYSLYAGTDVRSAEKILEFELGELLVLEKLEQALAPVLPFDRLTADDASGKITASYRPCPLMNYSEEERIHSRLPETIPQVTTADIRLKDVLDGKASMKDFIAQLSDEDLSMIVRGEGMGSSRVTPGTAAAFAGVSDRLQDTFGIPAICCDDGPSGMRLDCGTKAFSLPNGTMLACTFNEKLNQELFSFLSLEMVNNHVECLLGPGINIHRNPLNGRNFEYFSEDPFVTGTIASSQLKGLHAHGVTGTIKHFCANNQEFHRRTIDAVVSERALREIYLKGYEIAVKQGNADSIMTTYGGVNGLWTAGSYDLNTTILRNEWGYKGIVMTDWWAEINTRQNEKQLARTNISQMVRAQNDVYMVVSDSTRSDDNTLASLADGSLTRGELQKCAMNLCNFAMKTQAMNRMLGTAPEIQIINRPATDMDEDSTKVEFVVCEGDVTIPLDYKECKKGSNFVIALENKKPGTYDVILTASSKAASLAQIPCTVFYTSIPVMSYTFNGTEGKDVSLTREFKMRHRFNVMRLYVGANGLELKSIRFVWKNPDVTYKMG